LAVETDTLVGTLNYGSGRIATGTMGFKHGALNLAAENKGLSCTEFPAIARDRRSRTLPQ